MLEGLRPNGVELTDRTKTTLTTMQDEEKIEYELKETMEFTSDRKRMSVVIKADNGNYELYTKGADSVILKLLAESEAKEELNEAIDDFARVGLRTLTLAYKKLKSSEYSTFIKEYKAANTALEGRDEKVKIILISQITRAFEMIETNMELVGATAIEDKLQDKVPDSINYLLKAGIHVWLLTGDKQETAINISYSSKLLSQDMHLFKLNAKSKEECASMTLEIEKQVLSSEDDKIIYALIVDGATLAFVFENPIEPFINIIKKCSSVICCRVSPLQKALVVKLVRKKLDKITLSIGDGANDVSMIQAAHVGIGIEGHEGGQASRASDYSFVQFKYIVRLLAVHGRYSFLRLSKLIIYSFYKNITMIMVQFWYGFNSAFSANPIFDGIFLTLYNVVLTSFNPYSIAICEKDVSEKAIKKVTLNH